MSRSVATNAQLGQMLHDMFVDIRNLSSEPGHEKLINKIADVAELVPLQLINPDAGWMNSIILCLEKLAQEFPRAQRYLTSLDTDDAELKERLCPTHGVDWADAAIQAVPQPL